MNINKPSVSVVMITYGHEKYIKQAINSVLAQKTSFPVEVIIANDCSPDNTDNIVKEIIDIPNNFELKYTCHKKNKGMIANHQWAISQAKGKYIAICDGDDYWINENKLQTQFDFMESHPDYSICCHNFKILKDNTLYEESFFDNLDIKETSTNVDLSKNNIIPTLSAFFINKQVEFPTWSKDAPLGDLILFLNIAKYGKIKYFDEKWAVYRQNVGVWHKNKVDYLKMIKMYENISNDYRYMPEVSTNLNNNKKKYIKAYLKELALKNIIQNSYFNELSFIEKIKIFIKKLIS